MARRDALLRLHKSLMGRRNELRRRLGGELKDLCRTNTAAPSGDSVDAAFDSGSEEIASQLAELEAKELRQVERAITKIKNGTYGMCESCQAKIPVARLNALPYSTLCVNCKREYESDAGFAGGRLGGFAIGRLRRFDRLDRRHRRTQAAGDCLETVTQGCQLSHIAAGFAESPAGDARREPNRRRPAEETATAEDKSG